MINLHGPGFKDLYPNVPEYHNGKPTQEFGHYLSACSHACARADAQQTRAFDAAPEMSDEEIAQGVDGLRKLARRLRRKRTRDGLISSAESGFEAGEKMGSDPIGESVHLAGQAEHNAEENMAGLVQSGVEDGVQLYDPSGHHQAAMDEYNRLTRGQSRESAQRIRARDHAAMSDLEQMECDAAAHCGAWMGRS